MFAQSGAWQHLSPVPGDTAEPSPASCRAPASSAKNSRALLGLHSNTSYFVSCLCVPLRGKPKGWWAQQEAGWHATLQPPQCSGHSAALALKWCKPELLIEWKPHLPKGPFAFYIQHFKGSYRVLNN